MRRWSNGRFTATPHRVVNDPDRDRYSVAYFLRAELESGYDQHRQEP